MFTVVTITLFTAEHLYRMHFLILFDRIQLYIYIYNIIYKYNYFIGLYVNVFSFMLLSLLFTQNPRNHGSGSSPAINRLREPSVNGE